MGFPQSWPSNERWDMSTEERPSATALFWVVNRRAYCFHCLGIFCTVRSQKGTHPEDNFRDLLVGSMALIGWRSASSTLCVSPVHLAALVSALTTSVGTESQTTVPRPLLHGQRAVFTRSHRMADGRLLRPPVMFAHLRGETNKSKPATVALDCVTDHSCTSLTLTFLQGKRPFTRLRFRFLKKNRIANRYFLLAPASASAASLPPSSQSRRHDFRRSSRNSPCNDVTVRA